MTTPTINKPYPLAAHKHAHIDTAFTKPGGMAISTPAMLSAEEEDRQGRDPGAARLFWLAYGCVALPFVGWAALAIFQALQ